MKDIQISIFSMQDIGYDREGILTKTTGTYSFENGYHKVHYCELDEHGTATDNTLLFSNEKMELSKSGSVAAHFLFMSLENTYTEYLTAFGKFVFEIETENYHLEITEGQITIKLIYKLFNNNQLFSTYELSICICGEPPFTLNK